MEFSSLEDLNAYIKEYQTQNVVQLYKKDSRTIKRMKEICPNRLNNCKNELKYYSVTLACIWGGSWEFKASGLRNKVTLNCPMEIKVELTSDGQHLAITSLNEHHNHANGKEDFFLLPRQRKKNSEKTNKELNLPSLKVKQRKQNPEDKTNKSNFQNLCRTCSCEGDLQSLFVENPIRIADMLTEITDLKIMEGDPFPQNICKICFEKLKNAYNFFKQCYKTCEQFENLNNSINSTSIVDSSTNNDIVNENVIKEELILPMDCELEWLEDTKNENSEAENEEKPRKRKYKPTKHECPICSKKINNLKKHMRTHTKEKPYKCEICGMEFSSSGNCSRHLQIHLNDRPHVCQVCNKAFTVRHNLKIHIKTHSTDTPFKCELCEKSFRYQSQLKLHTTTIHQDSKQCLEILASIDTQRNFLCDLCGKSFISKNILQGHMRAHTGEKPFSCLICGKTFSRSSLLCLHRKIHSGEKPFKCSYCDKHFRMKKFCSRHELIHTGEKPLKCDLCGKCFRQSAHLYRHKKSHTGGNSYACTMCDKHFAVRDSLNAHIRVKHKGETPRVAIHLKNLEMLGS